MIDQPLPAYLVEAAKVLGRNIPRLRSAEMIKCDPDVEYLVEGIVPRRGVAAIYGASGAGKSFLAMDLVFNLASRRASWFHLPMRAAPVVYVALEGQNGLKKRMLAWEQHNGIELGDEVHFFTDPFRLDNPSDVEELGNEALALAGRGCVIIVDTLAQAMAGFDENTSAEMGAAIAGAQMVAAKVEGLVLLIHHTGKDPTKGMRGHSSLIAALDAAIEVSSKSGKRLWSIAKSKDGEAGQGYDFELVPYTTGTSAYGQPVISCAVRQTVHPPSTKLPAVTGRHRVAVMSKLLSVIASGGPGIDINAATGLVATELDCDARRRGSVARSTINGLVASGHLTRVSDTISLPP